MAQATKITVEATANAPVAKVWTTWNTPSDIMQWNTPDPSWHTSSSENDLRVGGKFKIEWKQKMAASVSTLKVFMTRWNCIRKSLIPWPMEER
ncbi:SRPBCC domain-containing protein [Olivibacter sp. XZL3]|uniref:SRPBCC domain-containing protein n=1 Tax=Olivibacter sp. XZL3 TaxID=1735116 RepID=UPI003519F779